MRARRREEREHSLPCRRDAGCDAEWFRDAMVLSRKEMDEGGGALA
jgi:hypothetical protein